MKKPMYDKKIEIDHERKIVRVLVSGQLKKNEGESIITEARMLAGQYQYNLLYDIRTLDLKVDLVDFFYVPRELSVFRDPQARKVKVALLVSPVYDYKDGYRFYENVAQNLGIQVRSFNEEEQAIAWLTAP